jgi:ribonuclease P protein component
VRVSGPYFAAICLRTPDLDGPRIGLTVPKALGKAVRRNRIKRRMRESVRMELWKLQPNWWIVFNPRKSALEAPFEALRLEVGKVFARCVNS